MAKPAAIFKSIRSGTAGAKIRVSKSSAKILTNERNSWPRLPRQTMTYMKTAVLFGAAALWCVPCLAKVQSADEWLRAIYTEEGNGAGTFPGLEGVAKPVPIACQG